MVLNPVLVPSFFFTFQVNYEKVIGLVLLIKVFLKVILSSTPITRDINLDFFGKWKICSVILLDLIFGAYLLQPSQDLLC